LWDGWISARIREMPANQCRSHPFCQNARALKGEGAAKTVEDLTMEVGFDA
jgi:hypothetical protein